MAQIESLDFSITRTSFPDGHVCSVEYSYYLVLDIQQYNVDETFSIGVELHGDDLMHDKVIGSPPYDTHMVSTKDKMPLKRTFAVDCDILDEAWGQDRIYLRIYVHSSRGERLTEKTATIKDWF